MSLFGKIKDALKKTREGVSTKLRLLFAKNKLGEEFYDELEEILISADVSVRTAEEVVEEVKEEAIGGKVKDQAFVTDLLKDILEEKLEEAPVPEIKYPCVIMFVGVNGVGKTTTIGKVANYFVSQKKSVTVAAGRRRIPSARRRAISSPSGRSAPTCASSSTRRGATLPRSSSTRSRLPKRGRRTSSSSIRRGGSTSRKTS